MAEPLKNRYGPEVPQRIGAMLAAVTPGFDAALFCRDVLADYEARDLMARGQRIAQVMREHLPASYPDALDRVMASIGRRGDGAQTRRCKQLEFSLWLSKG